MISNGVLKGRKTKEVTRPSSRARLLNSSVVPFKILGIMKQAAVDFLPTTMTVTCGLTLFSVLIRKHMLHLRNIEGGVSG